jgi:hypothetical protein
MKSKEEIEQLAQEWFLNDKSLPYGEEFGFINGYTQCQEDMANKKCYHPLPYRLAKSDVNFECTLCGKFI